MQVSRGHPMARHGCGGGNPEVWRQTDLCKGAGARKRVPIGIPEGVVLASSPEPLSGRAARPAMPAQSRNGTTMTATNVLNPHPPEFEPFLHATVGEDRNGYLVTVLSALARLGLDPWNETAELVVLGREAGRVRLGLLLSRFRDVPALGSDHASVALKLSLLLPESPRTLTRAVPSIARASGIPMGAMWTILAIVLIVLQMLFTGTPGSGE